MKDRPNILVIMSDQHNRGFLGCMGNGLVRTPNLDRLAAGGRAFTDAYCPAPLCVPSRMSFLTSLTPSANRVWNNWHILAPDIPTWAHHLALADYETVLLGRMHFCGPDQRHGFEKRPIGESSAGPVGMTAKGGAAWQAILTGSSTGQNRAAVEIAGRGHTHYQWADEERTRVAVRWLRERAAAGPSRPFAAVVGYVLPHCPFVAPRALFDYYYPRVSVPPVEENLPADIRRFRSLRGISDPPLPGERSRVALAAYYGLCEHLDALSGRVLDALEETRLSENTLVIYTSDHGEMAGEHGCWWKSNYYEGSAGVPLVARWPGVIEPGSTSGTVCNLLDIGPTLVEIAGCPRPEKTDGHSLLRALESGRDPDRPGETFSEFVDQKGGGATASRMVRSGPWKLWAYALEDGFSTALFNLERDPGETRDLAGCPGHRAVHDKLLARVLEGWDPGNAVRETLEKHRAWKVLAEWGRHTGADSPDALAWPPPRPGEVELL